MKSVTLRALALVVLVGASGCGAFSSSRPSEPVEAPEPVEATEPEEVVEPEARLRVGRHTGYGRDWDAAYDVILAARLQAFARLGVREVELSPHPVGDRFYRHIVRTHLHFDGRESKSLMVVANGELLEQGSGSEGLTTYLASLGFPRVVPPASLLAELACYFEVAIDDRSPWCAPAGESPKVGARVETTRDGVVLYLRPALVPSSSEPDAGGGDQPDEVTKRFELHFDAEAEFSIQPFRQRRNGAWQPLPVD